ncbi:hypothetical protein [Streptomyces sp. NPDC087297]|uniref:hypothetical protein n=1 Tax=Streptomyces sp. NPDC087297 TaxID=3365778 RepID=UPI00381FBA73
MTTTDIATVLHEKLAGRLGSLEPQITGRPETLNAEVEELRDFAATTGLEDVADAFDDALRALRRAEQSTGPAQTGYLAAARRALLEGADLLI